MPRSWDEIKHQQHALYEIQKRWPCLWHLTIWVLHMHVCWRAAWSPWLSHVRGLPHSRQQYVFKFSINARTFNCRKICQNAFMLLITGGFFFKNRIFSSSSQKQSPKRDLAVGEQTNGIPHSVHVDGYSLLICLNSLKYLHWLSLLQPSTPLL